MKIYDYEINENNVKSAPDTLKAEGNVTPRDIKHIFDRLPEFIAQKFNSFVDYVTGSYYTKEQTESAIALKVTEIGSADMQKSVYDSDNDGIVDSAMRAVNAENANTLEGKAAEYFAAKSDVDALRTMADTAKTAAENAQTTADSKADVVHTQSASTITAGTFPGNVVAYSANRSGQCLRNNVIKNSSGSTNVSTDSIIFIRK